MKTVLLSLGGAVLSVLAFPPFGPGLLIVPGIGLLLWALLSVDSRKQGFWIGFLYGVVFFGGFMWWLAELELIALAMVPVEALFVAWFGWWITGYRDRSAGHWLLLAVGGWAVMELVRYHFPVGGLEWGAAGYALSDNIATRFPAALVGTSGLTLMVVLTAALVAQMACRATSGGSAFGAVTLVLILGLSFAWFSTQELSDVGHPVAIVQGSTPCPFTHCPPNERLRTYEQHLALTRTLPDGSGGLVVWPESSTGSINADPVLNTEVGEAIGAEARRLGARLVIGGDRVISDEEFLNVNVYFEVDGNMVGEYRKQHGVPFGEYVPLRPLFDWIPALDRVPRDMVRGDGPVLLDEVGSVISFEGGFSRYALGVRRAGAEVIVVNTNTSSYGETPASDVWLGMTRMRAVELGVPIVHSAITGKSTVIDVDGSFDEVTGLGSSEILVASYRPALDTPYLRLGNIVMYLAALAGILTWVRIRRVVGSTARPDEEE